jgi:fatty acid desaturase
MSATPPITDPGWTRPEQYSAVERFFLPMLHDERDMIFIRTSLVISLTVVPVGLCLFALPARWVGLLAIPYLVLLITQFFGRYTLMLHATSHRRCFTRAHDRMNRWIPWLLGPFFGITPTSFFVHHMGMHHPENNMEADESSTLCYERDNIWHFLHYWARFFFFGDLHLSRYLRARGRRKLLRSLWIGELAWLAMLAVALWINWAAALVVFVTPLLLMRSFMMTGNFSQHAFIDMEDPDNGFKNSTCLTNTRYNHKCYNDGYHAVHHVKANLHWSQMPEWYTQHIDEFAHQDAVVFSTVPNNQVVWFRLMTHDYGWLADRVVQLANPPRSREETIDWLKARTRGRRGRIKGLWELS